MGQAELNSLVVLMDCCHGGSSAEQQKLLSPTQTTLSRKPNSCLIATCREFGRARKGPGPFAVAVLKGLAAENGVKGTVTSNDLYGYVEREFRETGPDVIHAEMGQAIDLIHYPIPTEVSDENPPATSARGFISYRSRPPDSDLAQEFYQVLKAAGHEVFMAAESIRLGDSWSGRIDEELERCDYFVLLLSPSSAASEMVTEEVRRARELRDTSESGKPGILPIRVNFPMNAPLNYDLRGYLNRIQQTIWESAADTPRVLQEIQSILVGTDAPLPPAPDLDADPQDSASEDLPDILTETPDAPPVPVAHRSYPGDRWIWPPAITWNGIWWRPTAMRRLRSREPSSASKPPDRWARPR